MNIISIADAKKPRNGFWDLFVPKILPRNPNDVSFIEYTVEKEQDMRLDTVMLAVYNNDSSVLSNMDIICYINDLDNPLNIYPGMKLIFPRIEDFEAFRVDYSNKTETSKIKTLLGTRNKTTRKDENRTKYLENNYSLPPTVMTTPREPVRLVGENIVMGGL